MGDLLKDVRVVDLTAGYGTLAARLLADLGASVVRVEELDARTRTSHSWRVVDGVDLGTFVRTAGTDVVDLDPTRDRDEFDALLAGADVALVSTAGTWGDPQAIAGSHPHLVVASITPLGLDGPCADWVTTDLVEQAMAGFLARAGVPELPPVAAPGRMAEDMGAVVAVMGALLALTVVRDGGPGQVVDVASVMALAHCTDMSLPLWSLLHTTPARNGAGSYPLYECRDGLARIVLPMSAGEWRSLIAWMGSPPEWTGGEWDLPMLGPTARAAIDERLPAMFARGTREELAAEGDAAGVRITPVLTPAEVLASEHARERATFGSVEVAPGRVGSLAASPFSVDGRRPAPRPARRLGREPEWSARPVPASGVSPARPLAGRRVLELGTGVASPEGARMMAEWGADVIKIESSVRPDFQRTVMGGSMNPAYATVGRGKSSFDVDLTTDDGLALVLDLVRSADVLVENNAAGVLGRLGLGWDVLHAANPRLVLVSTQLYGDRGPWAAKKGYGPSARAVGGLTWLWAHGPDAPRGVMTIHPDHLAGRLVAIAALSGLLERERTGEGRRIDIAQFEAVIALLAEQYLHESLEPGAVVPVGNVDPRHAPWGVYRCRDDADGVESWLALCVRDDVDWAAVCDLAGDDLADARWRDESGRVADRRSLDDAVARWAATVDASEIEMGLQRAGVPASRVLHPATIVTHPQYLARGWPVRIDQPGTGPLLLEGPALEGSAMGRPTGDPAPVLGADTDDVCERVLGLAPERIEALREAGILGPRPV